MKARISSTMVLALATLCLSLPAHETEEKNSTPGFRPECELASDFVAEVNNATVRVYQTIIRTPTNTTFSTESQQQVVDFLNEKKITKAVPDEMRFDVGKLKGRGQFDWFQNDMAAIGQEVEFREIDADYVLVMEVLFPPQRGNNQAVFGIHCIVLDAAGQNVFSFLLNSHHQLFIDAALSADDLSEQTHSVLVQKATAVGLEALVAQIQNETMKK